MSLLIPAGKLTALVGLSGSGERGGRRGQGGGGASWRGGVPQFWIILAPQAGPLPGRHGGWFAGARQRSAPLDGPPCSRATRMDAHFHSFNSNSIPGKSTLVSLIQRLYDPTAGAVLLGGTDLRCGRAPWRAGLCPMGSCSRCPQPRRGIAASTAACWCLHGHDASLPA